MKYKLFILVALLSLLSCAQGKKDTIDMEITSHYENYKYLNDSRPGYYLQVNNQNCYYEIQTNELVTGSYFLEFPSYSVRLPLNMQILKSGDQKLSIKVFPFKGDTLTNKANIDVSLIHYPDITDLENDFGGSTILWKWEMPKSENLKLPYFELDTVFKADVPYEINVLDDYAEDLSKMDREDLLKEVLTEFVKKRENIINKNESKSYLISHIKRSSIQIYATNEEDEDLADGMISISKGKDAQPLENFNLKLLYDNKVVTLVNSENKMPAIFFTNPETGARSWQPYYIFKNKKTGTWHMW